MAPAVERALEPFGVRGSCRGQGVVWMFDLRPYVVVGSRIRSQQTGT